ALRITWKTMTMWISLLPHWEQNRIGIQGMSWNCTISKIAGTRARSGSARVQREES
ncbi:hypothetical protein GCK32_005413, partial [Trichostrongylus colubriformis]